MVEDGCVTAKVPPFLGSRELPNYASFPLQAAVTPTSLGQSTIGVGATVINSWTCGWSAGPLLKSERSPRLPAFRPCFAG
jgi:hypothetical protein